MSGSFEHLNGCAVGDHQMWQDVRLAVDHEHASEFVSTIQARVRAKIGRAHV